MSSCQRARQARNPLRASSIVTRSTLLFLAYCPTPPKRLIEDSPPPLRPFIYSRAVRERVRSASQCLPSGLICDSDISKLLNSLKQPIYRPTVRPRLVGQPNWKAATTRYGEQTPLTFSSLHDLFLEDMHSGLAKLLNACAAFAGRASSLASAPCRCCTAAGELLLHLLFSKCNT